MPPEVGDNWVVDPVQIVSLSKIVTTALSETFISIVFSHPVLFSSYLKVTNPDPLPTAILPKTEIILSSRLDHIPPEFGLKLAVDPIHNSDFDEDKDGLGFMVIESLTIVQKSDNLLNVNGILPAEIPVTSPEPESIVATEGLLLVHVPASFVVINK